MATSSATNTYFELELCEIEDCQRLSATLCRHCNNNVCRRHFIEHAEELVQELNPLVDSLNELSEIINSVGVNEYKQRAFDQLTQWRDKTIQDINNLYEFKKKKLELLLQLNEEVFSQRTTNHLEVLDILKNETTFLIKDGDITFEQLEILKGKLQRLKEHVNQTQRRLVYCDIKPLFIDYESILLHSVTNDNMRGGTLLCPDYQMKLNDFYGNPEQRWELVYKATKDGFRAEDFHKCSDNKGPTMTIIQSKNDGYLFGGYAELSWDCGNKYKQDPTAFLFTLENPHGIQPTKFFKNPKVKFSVAHYTECGPIFGGVVEDKEEFDDILIRTDANKNEESYSSFPSSYVDTTGKGAVLFTGTVVFMVNEIEVYRRLDGSEAWD